MTTHPPEQLSAYLDGELSGTERAEVERHLAGCAACARVLADVAAMEGLAADLRRDDPPVPAGYFEALPGRVRDRIRAERRPRRLPGWALAAAAVLVVAAVAPIVTRQAHEEAPAVAPVPAPAGPAQDAPAAGLAASAPTDTLGSAEQDRLAPLGYAAPPGAAKKEAVRGGRADGVSRAAADLAGPAGERERPVRRDRVAQSATAPVENAGPGHPAAPGPAAGEAPAAAPDRQEVPSTTIAAEALSEAIGSEEIQRRTESKTRAQPAAPRGATLKAASPPEPGLVEARKRRDALADAADHPTGRLAGASDADERRVRAIEAAADVWRLSRADEDAMVLRRMALAYLARKDALRSDRVRSLLTSAGMALEDR